MTSPPRRPSNAASPSDGRGGHGLRLVVDHRRVPHHVVGGLRGGPRECASLIRGDVDGRHRHPLRRIPTVVDEHRGVVLRVAREGERACEVDVDRSGRRPLDGQAPVLHEHRTADEAAGRRAEVEREGAAGTREGDVERPGHRAVADDRSAGVPREVEDVVAPRQRRPGLYRDGERRVDDLLRPVTRSPCRDAGVGGLSRIERRHGRVCRGGCGDAARPRATRGPGSQPGPEVRERHHDAGAGSLEGCVMLVGHLRVEQRLAGEVERARGDHDHQRDRTDDYQEGDTGIVPRVVKAPVQLSSSTAARYRGCRRARRR
jgi:hypothetical protein